MDPNSIQPSLSQSNLSPETKTDKGISVSVLAILTVVVISSLVFLYFFLQKNTRQTTSIPIPTTNTQEPSSSSITAAPTPTPTPLQGPGKYSCSALGSCKNWDPQIQIENCTVTFADPNCLEQCGDTTKRCKF